MAETYPLTFPDQGIASVQLTAKTVIGVSTSPFTMKQQVHQFQGERFEATVTLPPMTKDDAQDIVSFLLRLRGPYGTFLLGDPSCDEARGSASESAGTPTINGAHNARAIELDLQGLPLSETGYLKAGDYIQIESGADARLHKVLTDVDTDSNGNATLDIFPSLRQAYAGNESVTVSNPKGIFRLASNEINWNVNSASVYGVSFGAIEVI